MIAKLLSFITSRETTQEITDRVANNPKTTRWGVVLASGFGAAVALHQSGYWIAGYLVGGATAVIAIGVQVFGRDPGEQ